MASKQNPTPDMQEMFTAFAAFMQGQQTETPATPATPARKSQNRTSKPIKRGTKAATLNAASKPKGTRPTRTTPKGVITCGDAWNLLGGDPQYKPSNPTAPARNAQLWALNAKGLLKLA